jgi:hypothetical protein
VLCCLHRIDVDDWVKHTDYRGFTQSDEVVQWFWKASRSFPSSSTSCSLLLTHIHTVPLFPGREIMADREKVEVVAIRHGDESYSGQRLQGFTGFRWCALLLVLNA